MLPWRVGEAYEVIQGNCTVSPSHSGIARFAYDIGMPIGTRIIAARAGTAIEVEERFRDGNQEGGEDNHVYVQHADGTVARYLHLTFEGAVVSEDELVFQGQTIGFSGQTGNAPTPHLHFDVVETDCGEAFFGPLCVTVPTTFSNTDPHAKGLQAGVTYVAR